MKLQWKRYCIVLDFFRDPCIIKHLLSPLVLYLWQTYYEPNHAPHLPLQSAVVLHQLWSYFEIWYPQQHKNVVVWDWNPSIQAWLVANKQATLSTLSTFKLNINKTNEFQPFLINVKDKIKSCGTICFVPRLCFLAIVSRMNQTSASGRPKPAYNTNRL